MLEALEAGLPGSFRWSRPEGGMFVWLEGPPGMDMDAVNQKAVERGVAAVPGRYFFAAPGQGENTLRLNFTSSDPPTLKRAVSVLCAILRESVSAPRKTAAIARATA